MPTPALIDFDTLLAPISDDAPCGADIREDASPSSVYYQLKDARSAARAAERSMDADDENPGLLSDWRTILELSPKVLATRAKDLEVAAWYAEALLRAEGFAGLRDGFQLIAGLVENFWDGVYPLPDEDGIETRVAPLTGLNGETSDGALIQPIRKAPLLPGGEKDYALWHYEQASDLARVADVGKRQARIDGGAVTMETLEQTVKGLPAAHFRGLLDDIDTCAAAFAAMGDKLHEKAGRDAPPAGAIRSVLSAARDAVADLGRDKLAMADAADAANAAAQTVADAGGASGPAAAGFSGGATAQAQVGGGVIASREDAFRVLLQIADFFRKTEPHSPISYTLEEVVRRGRLPLAELLEELIQDETTRKFFFIASGVKPPETKQEEGSSSSSW